MAFKYTGLGKLIQGVNTAIKKNNHKKWQQYRIAPKIDSRETPIFRRNKKGKESEKWAAKEESNRPSKRS